MTYTQAQIDKANAVDLEKFLRAQGETLVRSGKEYRWKAHDSLTVCGNKWFRHSQSKGGYPVFVIRLQKCGLEGRHVLSQNRRSQESQFIKRTQAELFAKAKALPAFLHPCRTFLFAANVLQ